jgi:hypothetical protein
MCLASRLIPSQSRGTFHASCHLSLFFSFLSFSFASSSKECYHLSKVCSKVLKEEGKERKERISPLEEEREYKKIFVGGKKRLTVIKSMAT